MSLFQLKLRNSIGQSQLPHIFSECVHERKKACLLHAYLLLAWRYDPKEADLNKTKGSIVIDIKGAGWQQICNDG